MSQDNNHIYTIFGASGDLTKRKLMPSLYALFVQKMLPENFAIMGASRSSYSDGSFRGAMKEALQEFRHIENDELIDDFTKHLYYTPVSFDDTATFEGLKHRLNDIAESHGVGGNRIFYLSTPPSLYTVIPQKLAKTGLNHQEDGWKRLVIEKPFGFDLDSALKLKDILLADWDEEQLFRIDHYLGKETVQNLLVTRFSNGFFEPLWNRNFIHHVEITSAESLGVETRGGYYDNSGALRDMVQNHLLQLTALTAMEPPSSLEPDAIRDEILKVLQSLRPFKDEDVAKNTIRGQYVASKINSEEQKAYRDEKGVADQSDTETYAALKFYIDNWRWGGVPFYIRTGKRLPTRVTEIVIHFKPTPHFLFTGNANNKNNSCNQLIIRIQPDEGILMKFGMKTPGSGFDVQNVNMDFHYSDLAHQRIPTAYERLIYDAVKGDKTLFARTEEVIQAWRFLMPVLRQWKTNKDIPLHGYPSGTWGPEKADDLIKGENMTWRYPCKNLTDDGIYCEL